MTPASPDPAHDLALALADALRETLESMDHATLDPDSLAARLAAPVTARLVDAAAPAGANVSALARGVARRPSAETRPDTVEGRVLAALQLYPGGRAPGVAPEALVNLTGLPQSELGPAVSSLVQSGKLVRDAWLVRLPNADDLLPDAGDDDRIAVSRQPAERRAIGDRRAVGERQAVRPAEPAGGVGASERSPVIPSAAPVIPSAARDLLMGWCLRGYVPALAGMPGDHLGPTVPGDPSTHGVPFAVHLAQAASQSPQRREGAGLRPSDADPGRRRAARARRPGRPRLRHDRQRQDRRLRAAHPPPPDRQAARARPARWCSRRPASSRPRSWRT